MIEYSYLEYKDLCNLNSFKDMNQANFRNKGFRIFQISNQSL